MGYLLLAPRQLSSWALEKAAKQLPVSMAGKLSVLCEGRRWPEAAELFGRRSALPLRFQEQVLGVVRSPEDVAERAVRLLEKGKGLE
jgi:hypothetical protein